MKGWKEGRKEGKKWGEGAGGEVFSGFGAVLKKASLKHSVVPWLPFQISDIFENK